MLSIAGRRYDPTFIVFDKDGTLISFDVVWHAWFRYLMEALEAQVSLDALTRQEFAATLGYDPQTDLWDPLGPLTLAATNECVLLMAGQLYRCQDVDWNRAITLVSQAEDVARDRLEAQDLVEPIGDVRGRLQQLKAQKIRLAVATTDKRSTTERNLEKLGIADLLETIVCGDDEVPLKPAPDMALAVCRRLGVDPREGMMVGDTVGDMLMARRAGYGHLVGVTSGAQTADVLRPNAHVVIPDIHAIEVL
ncbi:MAG: HAD-IA family hydrolase [Chloroflexota bacterium]|nr:HAD-IA family hydrolase [Chloroflexota bacterium]